MTVTIFGNGNIGQAVDKNFTAAGQTVEHIGNEEGKTINGDIVVLAVPYDALDSIVARYSDQLANKIVVDVTNPVNFETFDSLEVPADSSAAQELQAKLPESKVVKGFNTTFAATLANGQVAEGVPTTVLFASDYEDAKQAVMTALAGSPLETVNAGSLKRARELEAMGFLQMTLAASEQIAWTAGFGILK